MLTYTKLQGNRRQFLALTGLTLPEFQLLLTAFTRSYERLYLPDRTLVGRPRQWFPGGGRKGVLYRPEQKLLFMLVYLKTYPLQALMGELFGLSQPLKNLRQRLRWWGWGMESAIRDRASDASCDEMI
jgi:Helix-turn-helix of DDE superfamily endonuclease